MKAPFPYFGGKSRIAPEVWARFGDVPNYVEPFFGSGAVLLARPDSHHWDERIETVNDADCLLTNAWRAIQRDPDAVAKHADEPVSECDLHARHAWLVQHGKGLVAERFMGDPEFYDAKIAGWWVWGACCYIGSGWCSGDGKWASVDGVLVSQERDGVKRQLPHVGNGMGVHRKLPHLGYGRGVHRKLPHVGDSGRGVCEAWREHLEETMRGLAERLRRVRVCCGDWARVMGETVTYRHGLTGVFLDPPYSSAEREAVYAHESEVAGAVREWAIANGDNPLLRIALCGYEGEHQMPGSWECLAWKAAGGYGSQGEGRGRDNASRERIWFSPGCARPQKTVQLPLLTLDGEATQC